VIALSQATTLAGDRNGAGVILAGWLKAHPRDVAVLMEYGNLLLQGGNEAGARAEFEAVLKLQPYNAPALNNVAWVTQKSDPARAMKLITQAARISPRSGEILDTLAWMKWQQNDRKDVLPLLQRAHDLSPNPDITYHLAVALEGAGQRDEAKKTLTTLIASGAHFSELDQAKKLAAQWH
jgi:Flp pilus assembly protein TadD